MRAYLTPREAAAQLGLSQRTLLRRLRYGEITHLAVSPRVLRVEAAGLGGVAPDPTDGLPAVVRVDQLAVLLRISRSQIHQLVEMGRLPRRAFWRRHQIIRFLIDHTVEAP